MEKSKVLVTVIFISSLLICFVCQSCGEDEEPIFGTYQEIESGYKNCQQGFLGNQIEVLSDQGVCWPGNGFSECFTTLLTLTSDLRFMETSSGIKYYNDGSQEEGLQSESTGTFTHEDDIINLFEETRFGVDTTVLRIDMDGTLNLVNRPILNCELHGVYMKQ